MNTIFLLRPLFLIWFITNLAETNRTPFDLAEGESELVSGFNVEYRAGIFALIFIAEYAKHSINKTTNCCTILQGQLPTHLY